MSLFQLRGEVVLMFLRSSKAALVRQMFEKKTNKQRKM